MSMDEFEAIRLADHEGLYQEQAAERMNISRQTFGRLIEVARTKVARMLIDGLALRIEGGESEAAEVRSFRCRQCRHQWDSPPGTGRPAMCPVCSGHDLQGDGNPDGAEEQETVAKGRQRCCRKP